MPETERVAELVNRNVLDVDAVRAAGTGEVGVALVQHDVRVDEVTGPVVPPVGFTDIRTRIVAEEHLVLVVPGEGRATGRSAVDELNIRAALIVPGRGRGLDRRDCRSVGHVHVRRIDIVDNLIRAPGMSHRRVALYTNTKCTDGENGAECR